MNVKQYLWTPGNDWDEYPDSSHIQGASLILVFGAGKIITHQPCLKDLRTAFPESQLIGCSSGGEILGTSVYDDCLVATVIAFEKMTVHSACVIADQYQDSEAASKAFAEKLPVKNLRHVFCFADGLLTNGSEIARGFNAILPDGVTVTGGMACDDMSFKEVLVVCNDVVVSGAIAAVGLYGDSLKIGYGSQGGWLPFGPERLITAAEGSTLMELDGKPVLDLYKKYLGPEANNLPAAGILFPLSIRKEDGEEAIVRSTIQVNDIDKTIGFAGDMPIGWYARFMRAVPDDLIDGAIGAAKIAQETGGTKIGLVFLISCIGRKSVLKQLVEEETESVHERFGSSPLMSGFYSYGEIAPLGPGHKSVLHNQTMTVITISEV